jgi:hypothetical protein
MKLKSAHLLLFLLFLFLFFGCNTAPAKPKGFPAKFYPCELLILQDSKPLQNAVVQLLPIGESEKDWSSGGITNANGIAVLYTYGKWNGVPPNSYKVTVCKKIDKGDISFSLVNLNYLEASTTPLELTVKEKTTQTFDVGSAVYIKIK